MINNWLCGKFIVISHQWGTRQHNPDSPLLHLEGFSCCLCHLVYFTNFLSNPPNRMHLYEHKYLIAYVSSIGHDINYSDKCFP